MTLGPLGVSDRFEAPTLGDVGRVCFGLLNGYCLLRLLRVES